jgi:predicted TIM-barrel fold metal-dependent hydrolase
MLDGPGMLAYASDFPHDHGDAVAPLLDLLDTEDRRRVVHDTAAEFYGLRAVQAV